MSGYDIPVLINMYGTQQRMAWALGVEQLEDLVERVQGLLQLRHGPPEGLMNKLRTLGQLVHLGSFQPKTVRNAPCQEVVYQGDEVDLFTFPILKCWPLDGGRYITLPLVITRDPDTGVQNYGTYRLQVYDRNTTGMHWQTHKVGTHHYRISQERGADRLEVAVALGGDPASIWTGSAPLPPDLDEMVVAGFLREEGVELVQGKTVDLLIPAQAEIVLEGYVIPGEERPEGPFGDHTGYYSMTDSYPVFHVDCITHRRDPIYLTTVVGRPPMEDYWMGKVTERVFLPMLRMLLPELVDMNMPAEGIFHNLVIVSIKKEYPGQARKVMHGLWGLGLMSLAKTIIVVDHFVNVQDLSEVAWRVANNIDPGHDLVLTSGPVDDLDHASMTPRFGSKIGIDATQKGPSEGRLREWPPDIVMSPEIKDLVDRKWSEYGIGLISGLKHTCQPGLYRIGHAERKYYRWFCGEPNPQGSLIPGFHTNLGVAVCLALRLHGHGLGCRRVARLQHLHLDNRGHVWCPDSWNVHQPVGTPQGRPGQPSDRRPSPTQGIAQALGGIDDDGSVHRNILLRRLQLNGLALALAPVAAAYVVLYSYAKYHTWACNFLLGWALAISPSAAWIAVTGRLDPEAALLSFAVAAWAGGFDVIYGCTDYDFDGRYGIKSVPRRFGIAAACGLLRACTFLRRRRYWLWACGLGSPISTLSDGPSQYS